MRKIKIYGLLTCVCLMMQSCLFNEDDIFDESSAQRAIASVNECQEILLEELGYIECSKGFVGRKPRTVFRATKQGREAFKSHIEALENFLKST